MNTQKKLVSLLGVAAIMLVAAFTIASCKTPSAPEPVAVLKSSDGNATITVNSWDKSAHKGTCSFAVKMGGETYEGTADFSATETNVTFSNAKPDTMKALEKAWPIDSAKGTAAIMGFVFDIKPLLK